MQRPASDANDDSPLSVERRAWRTAIAEIAQAFHDCTRRALETIRESNVGAHLVRAIDHWQTSVATELKKLYRQGATQ